MHYIFGYSVFCVCVILIFKKQKCMHNHKFATRAKKKVKTFNRMFNLCCPHKTKLSNQ